MSLAGNKSVGVTAHKLNSITAPLLEGESLSLHAICMADREKHYTGDEISGDAMFASLEDAIQKHEVYRAGDSIFLGDRVDGGGLDFHTCNADTAEDLIQNVHAFFSLLKAEGYTHALTYYDYPKINRMWEYITFPSEYARVDAGKYKTFLAKVSL